MPQHKGGQDWFFTVEAAAAQHTCVTSSACVSSKHPHCWQLRLSQNSTLPGAPAASRCPPSARQCSGSISSALNLRRKHAPSSTRFFRA